MYKTKNLIILSLLGALMLVLQVMTSSIPNIEPVSFLLIIYTLVLGKQALVVVVVFNFLLGLVSGMGTWWFGYWVVWPMLVFIVLLFRKIIKENFLGWSIVSGVFGMLFGALYSIPYIFTVSKTFALTYWINGIPYDLIHMVGNYFIMLILGKRVYDLLKKLVAKYDLSAKF
ncbi:hypothetical protein [Clostridium sp. UBA1056]|jgi:energy-coupling factor transport system substrate-specific component|uniref:hypothetical protein n=1 Tax=unclassified Clostridium TaxID=2614128 RepID=UPI0032163D71